MQDARVMSGMPAPKALVLGACVSSRRVPADGLARCSEVEERRCAKKESHRKKEGSVWPPPPGGTFASAFATVHMSLPWRHGRARRMALEARAPGTPQRTSVECEDDPARHICPAHSAFSGSHAQDDVSR